MFEKTKLTKEEEEEQERMYLEHGTPDDGMSTDSDELKRQLSIAKCKREEKKTKAAAKKEKQEKKRDAKRKTKKR